MKDEITETIKGIKNREIYFENQIKNHESFKAEYVATVKINEILKSKPIDFEKIKAIIQETESKDHYNGSGWHDLKLRLNYLVNLVSHKR